MNTWMGVIGGATGHRRHHVKIRRIRRRRSGTRERDGRVRGAEASMDRMRTRSEDPSEECDRAGRHGDVCVSVVVAHTARDHRD